MTDEQFLWWCWGYFENAEGHEPANKVYNSFYKHAIMAVKHPPIGHAAFFLKLDESVYEEFEYWNSYLSMSQMIDDGSFSEAVLRQWKRYVSSQFKNKTNSGSPGSEASSQHSCNFRDLTINNLIPTTFGDAFQGTRLC